MKTSVIIITIPAPKTPHSNLIINNQLKSQWVSKVVKWMNINGYVILWAIIKIFALSNSTARITAGIK